jgi:hypothetical protein
MDRALPRLKKYIMVLSCIIWGNLLDYSFVKFHNTDSPLEREGSGFSFLPQVPPIASLIQHPCALSLQWRELACWIKKMEGFSARSYAIPLL